MSRAHQRIGPTAHYTAYVWKQLGIPYADSFATPTGALLYWGLFAAGEWTTRIRRDVPSMREYLEYRHRLIDAVVATCDPDLVVELGCGLSSRAIRYAAAGVRAIDVDLPAMIARKWVALARVDPSRRGAWRARLELRAADVLAPGFPMMLRAWVGEARRPVIIAEGLLSYFAPEDRGVLVRTVAAALGEGEGAFVGDLHTEVAQARLAGPTHALRTAIRVLTRRRRALDPYRDEDELRHAVLGAGFSRVDLVDARSFAATDPRLAGLRSPAHIIVATVGPDGPQPG